MEKSTIILTKRESAARARRMAGTLSRADDRASLLQFAKQMEDEADALEREAP